MDDDDWTKWTKDERIFYITKEEFMQIKRILKKIVKIEGKTKDVSINSITYLLLLWFLHHYEKNLLTIPDDFPLVRKYKGKRFSKLKKFQDTFKKYYKNIN